MLRYFASIHFINFVELLTFALLNVVYTLGITLPRSCVRTHQLCYAALLKSFVYYALCNVQCYAQIVLNTLFLSSHATLSNLQSMGK